MRPGQLGRSAPDALKQSLELGGDVCAECAVAEMLSPDGGAAGARQDIALPGHSVKPSTASDAAPVASSAAPALASANGGGSGARPACALPEHDVVPSTASDAGPVASSTAPALASADSGGGSGGSGRASGAGGRVGKRGRGGEPGGSASRGGPTGGGEAAVRGAGAARRGAARWETRVAAGRGTRRAALAAEVAAQAEDGAGATHFARVTPLQARLRSPTRQSPQRRVSRSSQGRLHGYGALQGASAARPRRPARSPCMPGASVCSSHRFAGTSGARALQRAVHCCYACVAVLWRKQA